MTFLPLRRYGNFCSALREIISKPPTDRRRQLNRNRITQLAHRFRPTPRELEAIRQAVNQSLVLGTERFKDQIDATLRRRARPEWVDVRTRNAARWQKEVRVNLMFRGGEWKPHIDPGFGANWRPSSCSSKVVSPQHN